MEAGSSVLVSYTDHDRPSGHIYDNILLSLRGSERQRKSHLQMACMFEDLMREKALEIPDALVGLTQEQAQELCFERVVNEYNDHGEAAAVSKYQLATDDKASVRNLIMGVHANVKKLMRSHLDKYKGNNSGTGSQLKKTHGMFISCCLLQIDVACCSMFSIMGC